jgi:phage terminase large subunit GpA-like protein
MPNLDKLSQKWTGDLQPTIEGSGYGVYLPAKGPASRGGRPAALRINEPEHGHRLSTMFAMALGRGGSESSTSSNPCAFLLIDEADDAEDVGQLNLAEKRTAGYGAMGGGIITSTVNERRGRELHPVLERYQDTTQSRLGHLCPHCQARVTPNLEHFNPNTATITCPSCGVVWSEADRHLARNSAEYVHGRPDAETFGILYVALDYGWEFPDPATGKVERMLVALAREHLSAAAAKERGDPTPWNTYLRKQWCRPESADDAEVPQTIDLEQAARATKSPHRRGEIPKGSAVIATGCDTGKRDGWMLQLSMAQDMSWHVLDWGHRTTPDPKAEPSQEEQRTMLAALRDRIARLGRCDSTGVDVGYNTAMVCKWAKTHGIRLLRGDPRAHGRKEEDANKTLPSWAEARRQDDGSVWLFLDVAIIKTEIAKALARKPGEPGAGHLPLGQEAGDWLIRHITAEVWDSKHATWVKRPGRDNHLLDCLVYAWALAVLSLNRTARAPRKYGVVKSL